MSKSRLIGTGGVCVCVGVCICVCVSPADFIDYCLVFSVVLPSFSCVCVCVCVWCRAVLAVAVYVYVVQCVMMTMLGGEMLNTVESFIFFI